MVDHPTSLDAHRGMAAQKATELRRLRSEVEADQAALHARQRDLEDLLAAAPATNWPEAIEISCSDERPPITTATRMRG